MKARDRSQLAPLAAVVVALVVAGVLTFSKPVGAQSAQSPQPAPPAGTAALLDDPDLQPPPPAPHSLRGWRELLAYVSTRSVDVGIATLEIDKAEAQRRQALALLLPTVSASASVTQQLITGPTGSSAVDPSTNQVVQSPNPTLLGQLGATVNVVAPRAWYGLGTADLNADNARLGRTDRLRMTLATASRAVIAVLTAERVAEIRRVGLRGALGRLKLTQQRFALSDATRLDAVRAEQDVALARATIVSGDEALRQAREALGLALGFDEPFDIPRDLTLSDLERTVEGACSATDLLDRSDVRRARTAIEVANRGITDAWLQFAPVLSLSTAASLTNDVSTQPDLAPGAWNMSLMLSVPLWDGGAHYADARIARANTEEARLSFESLLRTASVDVSQALRAVGVAEQARAASLRVRDMAREAAALARRVYEVGTGTSFDLVNTAQQERAAEVDLAVKELDVAGARLRAVLVAANCAY